MHIRPSDFISQIMTMTPTASSLLKKGNIAPPAFSLYFTRKSLSLFLTPFTPRQYPSVTYTGYINDTPPDASFVIVARDSVKSRMHMWESTNADLETRNVIMIPGAAVDHQIFTLPTIRFNAVNYLTRRLSSLHPRSPHRAAHDCAEQLDDLRRATRSTGMPRVYPRARRIQPRQRPGEHSSGLSHCMGSVSFSTGLLDGTIPAQWILGITASQVFMNPGLEPREHGQSPRPRAPGWRVPPAHR